MVLTSKRIVTNVDIYTKNKYCFRLHSELALSKCTKLKSGTKENLKETTTSIDVDYEFSDSESYTVVIDTCPYFN